MNNVCATLTMMEDLLEQANEDRPREPEARVCEADNAEFVLPMSEAILV